MSRSAPELETSEMTSADAAVDFRCGKEPLDRFFHQQATQNQKRGVSRTWILRSSVRDEGLPEVLGFHTLAVGSVERHELTLAMAKRLPNYPIPMVLVARLARHERVRGLGVGERLLRDAHLRVLTIASQANAVLVVVDAKDEDAQNFYAKFGYRPLEAQVEPGCGPGGCSSRLPR